MLKSIAADNVTTPDDCLYGESIDFAGTVCSQLKIPGYRRAYLFPGQK